jgi:ParB/RepB/Spo0J family partition protein
VNEVKYVLRKQVRPDPDQPRKTFDKEKLEELAESVKAVGIRAPIQVEWVTGLTLKEPDLISKCWTVEQNEPWKNLGNFDTEKEARACMEEHSNKSDAYYKIIDGERRWRAAELAGVERIPVMIVDTSAPDWEKQKLAIQLVLNQQHENVTALEEAAAYQKEIESGRHTPETLYKQLGISRGSLFSRLALNRAEKPVHEALLAGRISVSVAGLLSAVAKADLEDAIGEVEGMSFREAQREIEEQFARQLKNAPFEQERAYAMNGSDMVRASEESGACMTCKACPHRSGNMEASGMKNPNVCTVPQCYDAKVKTAADAKLAEAKANGLQVLPEKETKNLFNDWDSELRYSAPFVDLNQTCEPLGYNSKKTWRTALGDAVKEGKVKVAVAIDPAGVARELVKEEDAKKVLKQKGFKLESESSSYTNSAEHKKYLAMQRKKNLMEKTAGPASAQILEKLVGLKHTVGIDDRFWPMIAESVFHHTNIEAHAFVAKRRGLTKVQTDCRQKLEKWLKEHKDDAAECARMTVDLLFCACWNGGWSGGPKWDKKFIEACGWAGVKLEKLHEATEAAAAKKKEEK